MTLARLVVEVPVRPFSLNAERAEHRFARAKRVAAVRELAMECALEALMFSAPKEPRPLFWRVKVEVRPWAKTRQYDQDPGNCLPSAKAIVDGFIDAKIVPNDTRKHVSSIEFFPHQFGRDAMELTLIGELFDPGKVVMPVKTTRMF